jgi:hypothetical protein
LFGLNLREPLPAFRIEDFTTQFSFVPNLFADFISRRTNKSPVERVAKADIIESNFGREFFKRPMKGAFEDVDFSQVRLLSFEDNSIRVVLQDGSEVQFSFRNREEVEGAFQRLLSKGKAGRAVLEDAHLP